MFDFLHIIWTILSLTDASVMFQLPTSHPKLYSIKNRINHYNKYLYKVPRIILSKMFNRYKTNCNIAIKLKVSV